MSQRDEKRARWLKMEKGEIPNDYTNPILNHFGFCDFDYGDGLKERREITKYQTSYEINTKLLRGHSPED